MRESLVGSMFIDLQVTAKEVDIRDIRDPVILLETVFLRRKGSIDGRTLCLLFNLLGIEG